MVARVICADCHDHGVSTPATEGQAFCPVCVERDRSKPQAAPTGPNVLILARRVTDAMGQFNALRVTGTHRAKIVTPHSIATAMRGRTPANTTIYTVGDVESDPTVAEFLRVFYA